ncbi:MAG: ABC transporter substrate-binding protein [Xanthobacteraceae bacterium]
MNRRKVLLLAGAATASLWPVNLLAQRGKKIPLLGVLLYGDPKTDPNIESFRHGLGGLGYVDGENITIGYRYADGRPERLPELGAELVRLKPDVLLALGGDVVRHVHTETKTIPIVFAISSDPVRSGLVASLGRPGGNATGFTFLQDELASKRLALLKEVVPSISNVGFLFYPMHLDNELREAERAALALGVKLHPVEMRGSDDLDRALDRLTQIGVDSLYVVSSRPTVASVTRILAFATKNKLPVAGGWGTWVEAGALISYGPNVLDITRQSAVYVDKILKGAKPADLPAQQPTRFELFVNLKTAKSLGLAIPESFLLQADKIIE